MYPENSQPTRSANPDAAVQHGLDKAVRLVRAKLMEALSISERLAIIRQKISHELKSEITVSALAGPKKLSHQV